MLIKYKAGAYSSIPVVFVLMLFFLISVLSCSIIGAGGAVFSRISDDMNYNYESRVSFAYLTTKIRQGDNSGMITSEEFQGVEVLAVNEEYDEDNICTYLYYYDGYIRELFFERGLGLEEEMKLDDGDKIIEANGFAIKFDGNMITLTLTGRDNNIYSTKIALRSDGSND